MGWPAGVVTALFVFPDAIDSAAQGIDTEVTVTLVAPTVPGPGAPEATGAARITWAADGTDLVAFAGTFKNPTALPFAVSDQVGWVDGAQRSYQGFAWKVTVARSGVGMSSSYSTVIQPVTGQTSIIVSTQTSGPVNAPVAAIVPAVTSFNGETGALTFTASDINAEPAGLSEATQAELSTTIVAKPTAAKARGVNGRGYRTWDSHISGAFATPRVYIVGHSVVAGTNASDSAHQWAHIVGNTLGQIYPSITTTISGHSGFTTTQILAAETTPASKQSVVLMMAMLNDFAVGVPSATTKSNLEALIALYRAAPQPAPGPSIVLIGEWLRIDVAYGTAPVIEPWENYLAVAQQIADADDDVAFIDMSQRLGDVVSDPADLNLFAPDGVHPNDNGHALIAQAVLAELMHGSMLAAPPQKYPRQTSIDCTIVESFGGTVTPVLTPTGGVNRYTRDSDGTQGAWMQWTVPLGAGVYQMAVYHRLGSNRGQYSLYLDGALIGSGNQVDGYAASAADGRTGISNFTISTSKEHTIRLEMDAKNASASSYIASLSQLVIQRMS